MLCLMIAEGKMRDNAGYPFGRGDDGKHATLLAYSEYANFGGGLYIPSKFR